MLKRFFLFILPCYFNASVQAQTGDQEANLKAVFIYNFTKYVDWNPSSVGNEFVIGVIGSSDVTDALTEIAKTNTVNNKRIIVRSFNEPVDIDNCQILFIPEKIPFSLTSVLDKLGKGVLTISEKDGYARQGTAFNFIIRNDKLKFEANLKAIDAAGLKASSQLLKLAIIVD